MFQDDQNSESRTAIRKAARILANARYAISLVGAGISVESGIPPFRGPGGLWTKQGEPDMRGYDRFLQDPKAWWEARLGSAANSSDLIDAIRRAEPNPAHYALTDLETMGIMKCIVTQNIDNMHQRAGSINIAEIHGNSTKIRCIECGTRFPRAEFTFENLPPKCPSCNGLVKTDTVMFGEPIPNDVLERCYEEAYRCDCLVTIGTSAVVYPAAQLPITAKQNGARMIEINPMETPLSAICDVIIRMPAGEALPLLVEKVREEMGNTR